MWLFPLVCINIKKIENKNKSYRVVFYKEKKNTISNHNLIFRQYLLFVRFDFSAEILSDKSSMERWQKATEIDISSFFIFKFSEFCLHWNIMHCQF